MLDIILSVCWPLLALLVILLVVCTLNDGESPISIIGEFLTYCREGKTRGATAYPNRKAVIDSQPICYQRDRPITYSLNNKLDEIRHEKKLAKIKLCVLSGREKAVEKQIELHTRNRER